MVPGVTREAVHAVVFEPPEVLIPSKTVKGRGHRKGRRALRARVGHTSARALFFGTSEDCDV